MDRRDWLAQLLTDDDVETLKHLAREGMGENGLRALASDLAYLETWADAATGQALSWPASEVLALKFVAHHLWDPAKRVSDPRHGMPADVARELASGGVLRCEGPMPQTPSSGVWRAGARCTDGKGSRDRSRSLRSACAGPFAPRRGRAAQGQAGRHSGCLGSVDRDLRDGSSGRFPGSRDRSVGVRIRPAPAYRSGAAARRAAEG